MNQLNYYALFGLVCRALAILVSLYCLSKQIEEVMQPKTWWTRLSWIILWIFILTIVAAIPPLTYQYTRLAESPQAFNLRNLSSITSNLSILATSALLLMIYTFKRKDDEK